MRYSKVDLINELSLIRGYKSYLEICTPTTGNLYHLIDRSRYVCHRLMYRCRTPNSRPDSMSAEAASFDDGMPIDFRSDAKEIADCVAAIQASNLKFDVILADSFHEYGTSARDLNVAIGLLSANGTIIVHDCYPRDPALTVPHFIEGAWCGVSYKAYLDIVWSRNDLSFCTVDADFGCGVIRIGASGNPLLRPREKAAADTPCIVGQWMGLGDDYDAAFALLTAHAATLLNLVKPEEFLAAERASVAADA